MTWALFVGCLLIAFGPPVAFFLLVIWNSAKLVIVCIGSSFFWLFGMFVASILWYTIYPARELLWLTVPIAALCCEAARFLFWLVWTKGHESLNQDAGRVLDTPAALFWESVSAGLGFAFASSLIMFAGVVWNAFGPGVLINPCCFNLSTFVVGAVSTLLMGVLHVLWTVVAHRAFVLGRFNVRIILVLLDHVLVSTLTVFNSGQFGTFTLACLIPFIGQIVSIVVFALFISRDMGIFRRKRRGSKAM